jgi:hypothetical protein
MGVGTSVCACQGCIHPLGLGDLQKGEQYIIFAPNILYSPITNCPADTATQITSFSLVLNYVAFAASFYLMTYSANG